MKMKLITAAALVVAFAIPAFAAEEFYLVQDTATKHCSIVEAKPTESTMKAVGAAHKTRAEAEAAMKADKSCITP
jgi:type IV secretory pathway component VirB8